MDPREEVRQRAEAAHAAARWLAPINAADKNAALAAIADALAAEADAVRAANAEDVEAARAAGRSDAFVDRLALTDARIAAMAEAARRIAALPDPVGQAEATKRPNGLSVARVRVPIGVIGIVYESRPNVTVDAACLCMKAGNACLLRGGSDAARTNRELARIMTAAGAHGALPDGWLQVVESTDREAVTAMARLEGLIDLIIPRGGEELIRTVVREARVPVIKHYKGVCHIYVDATAELDKAAAVIENAKVQRPGVCNAVETLLIHRTIAEEFVPQICERLMELGVEIRGCNDTQLLVPEARKAAEADWEAEYLDLKLAVRIVDGLDDAVRHIQRYGSGHTDAILTRDVQSARLFVQRVDSSSVMVNASTRFADGGEYGLGAEIGISTDKLHARGPMGLADLTTWKWVVHGDGHVRA
jgi:glutamate-5-semialdehyde dehydrogenase